MDATWNFVMPLEANQSVAVEALALSLASSFEVAEVNEGEPTSLRNRGADPSERTLSIAAAEAEFTRCWAIAAAEDDPNLAEILELAIQGDLLEAVASYMEVHDLGYMNPVPSAPGQLALEFGCAGVRGGAPGKLRMS